MNTIDDFKGQYAFLSNFYASPMIIKGCLVPTIEHAFQMYKCVKDDEREHIASIVFPTQAKQAGKTVKLRKDWEDIKDKVMLKLVRQKFTLEPLRIKLLETKSAKLIHGNLWRDVYWGVCKGEGENKLGKILMKVRKELQE